MEAALLPAATQTRSSTHGFPGHLPPRRHRQRERDGTGGLPNHPLASREPCSDPWPPTARPREDLQNWQEAGPPTLPATSLRCSGGSKQAKYLAARPAPPQGETLLWRATGLDRTLVLGHHTTMFHATHFTEPCCRRSRSSGLPAPAPEPTATPGLLQQRKEVRANPVNGIAREPHGKEPRAIQGGSTQATSHHGFHVKPPNTRTISPVLPCRQNHRRPTESGERVGERRTTDVHFTTHPPKWS